MTRRDGRSPDVAVQRAPCRRRARTATPPTVDLRRGFYLPVLLVCGALWLLLDPALLS